MRQLNKKLRKEIQGFNLEELTAIIMYNSFSKDSKIRRDPFENWFDKKEKLIPSLICDCNNKYENTKIDWRRYGNSSPFRNFRDFLDQKNDYDRNWNNKDLFDSRINTLGTYGRMQSPGKISLYIDNIQVFFWSIICEMICHKKYIFTREKIEELAKLCILKTLYHELFHHFIDVQSRFMKDFHYDYYIDEALAVACSRQMVGFETQGNQAFVSDFLELAYSFKLPGYCDWIEYKSDEQFLLKLSEYITIFKPLSTLGQEVTPITESMLYSVFENPNIDFRIHI
jgi:hypothetical protein